MMNVTHVVTSAIGIENIDSEHSTRVVFGNQKSNNLLYIGTASDE